MRRDVDRLRELGYPIAAVKGPDGGYRLDRGADLPPLLFDDEQAVALAVGLQLAEATGPGVGEAAARALVTVRQVLPSRLRRRVDAVQIVAAPTRRTGGVDTAVLSAVSSAVYACEVLRFDYDAPGRDAADGPPRRAEPLGVASRNGLLYVVAWDLDREDWRTFRLDRLRPRTPNGPRFRPRALPGGDIAAFLAGRLRGTDGSTTAWPCEGRVIVDLPVAELTPYVHDGVVEEVTPTRSRVQLGAWSWPALAARIGQLDAEVEVVGPDQLRDAFAVLAERFARTARTSTP